MSVRCEDGWVNFFIDSRMVEFNLFCDAMEMAYLPQSLNSSREQQIEKFY